MWQSQAPNQVSPVPRLPRATFCVWANESRTFTQIWGSESTFDKSEWVAFNLLGVSLPTVSSMIGQLQPSPLPQNDRYALAGEPHRSTGDPRSRVGITGWAQVLGCPLAVWGQVDRMFPQAADIPGRRWQAVGDLPFPVTRAPGRLSSPCQGHAPLACQPFLPHPQPWSAWSLGPARGTSLKSQRRRLGSQALISP